MLEVAANITHICLRSLLPIVTGYEGTSIDVLMGTVSVACPGRVLCPLRNTHREYYRHATSQRFRASKSRATVCWGGMGRTKDAEARISIRRIIDASDESEFEIEELSSGFCNSVYLVKAEQDRQPESATSRARQARLDEAHCKRMLQQCEQRAYKICDSRLARHAGPVISDTCRICHG